MARSRDREGTTRRLRREDARGMLQIMRTDSKFAEEEEGYGMDSRKGYRFYLRKRIEEQCCGDHCGAISTSLPLSSVLSDGFRPAARRRLTFSRWPRRTRRATATNPTVGRPSPLSLRR